MYRHVIAFAVVAVVSVASAAAQTGAPATPAAAAAQRPAHPVLLDLNAAFAGAAPTIETTSTFTLFGEAGAAATRQSPAASFLADARAGYRFTGMFGVALGFSGGRSETVGKTAATVPSAVRFASPSVVTLDVPDLKRREADYHVQILWYPSFTLPGHTSLVVSGGPTFVQLQQSVPGVDPGANGTSVTVANEKGSGIGVHVGGDLAYALSERVGVGLFVRYVSGHVDLPSAKALKVGGVQTGGGVRLRF